MVNITRSDNPFAGLSSLHSQIDDMFNGFFSTGLPLARQGVPSMDVYTEGNNSLVAEVQAPGFTKDDITVSVHEGTLEIRGQHGSKEEEGKKNDRNYMVRESHASFYRSMVLPRNANADKVKATLENGVLTVKVPFKALPKPKQIAITASKTSK